MGRSPIATWCPNQPNLIGSSGGICSCKRVHAPLSYGQVTVQQSSNVVANSGSLLHFKFGGRNRKKERRRGGQGTIGLATHLSQVRSVTTSAVASRNAECAADVRPWTEFLGVVGVGDCSGGCFGLAGGDGEIALRARLDVDCLCVGKT